MFYQNELNIILRDMRESDIDDDIRWYTEETDWAQWDAPWEMEADLANFDPAAYRRRAHGWLAKPGLGHRTSLEIETEEGVHIGHVAAYCLDEDFNLRKLSTGEDPRAARWAVGIDICESAYWSGGWGTRALTAWVRYYLEAGYTDLYTQTWSGNTRMIALAEKLGFRECRRKAGIRQVRGGSYDGLTFRLDREAFAAHCAALGEEELELHIPSVQDMAFVQKLYADPATMAYNAGWAGDYPGYCRDTGCIDFPAEQWAERCAWWVGREPERFYALVRERATGKFVGEANYHYTPSDDRYEIGVVVSADCRGRGWGAQALALLLRRAFLCDGLPEVYNSFEEGREPALTIHRKAGFRQVGEVETQRFGGRVKVLEVALTREEYLGRRKKP